MTVSNAEKAAARGGRGGELEQFSLDFKGCFSLLVLLVLGVLRVLSALIFSALKLTSSFVFKAFS